MKKEEQVKDWDEEMKTMAPWLPLTGPPFQKIEAPKSYFEDFDVRVMEKMNATQGRNIRNLKLNPLWALVAGFLVFIFIGKTYLLQSKAKTPEEEYNISTLSMEEASLWLYEEAVISDLDLQIYMDGLTQGEPQKKEN